jgi:hypothetical protein
MLSTARQKWKQEVDDIREIGIEPTAGRLSTGDGADIYLKGDVRIHRQSLEERHALVANKNLFRLY